MINLPLFEDRHRALHGAFSAWAAENLTNVSDDAASETRRLVHLFGKAGWLDYAVNKIDVRSLCILREIAAYHHGLADFAFAMQGLGSGPISLFGSDAQKEQYLPRVRTGEAVAAFAITEAEAGSDVSGMKTTATKQQHSWLIQGEKTYISNAGIADHYVVFAKLAGTERKYGAFILHADEVTITRTHNVMAPHVLADISMHLHVPAERMIGSEGSGLKVALATLDVFRTSVAAAALGFARRAAAEAIEHTRKRKQFGKALSEFQLTQAKVADMVTAIDASALLIYKAAWEKDSGEARITMSAAKAKLFATESAQRVIDDALQLHGGAGVIHGTVVERLYREIRALRIYEGTSEIQKLVIAGQIYG